MCLRLSEAGGASLPGEPGRRAWEDSRRGLGRGRGIGRTGQPPGALQRPQAPTPEVSFRAASQACGESCLHLAGAPVAFRCSRARSGWVLTAAQAAGSVIGKHQEQRARGGGERERRRDWAKVTEGVRDKSKVCPWGPHPAASLNPSLLWAPPKLAEGAVVLSNV